MPKPATLALFAVALVGAASFAALPSRRGLAQPGASVPNIGRYQVMQSGEARSCFVIDTATGQTWCWIGRSWSDLGSPATPKR